MVDLSGQVRRGVLSEPLGLGDVTQQGAPLVPRRRPLATPWANFGYVGADLASQDLRRTVFCSSGQTGAIRYFAGYAMRK